MICILPLKGESPLGEGGKSVFTFVTNVAKLFVLHQHPAKNSTKTTPFWYYFHHAQISAFTSLYIERARTYLCDIKSPTNATNKHEREYK